MCVSPSFIYAEAGPRYERLEVACGWCWSCQKNRLNDLVGRCLLEQARSDWSRVLTLTYRNPDYPLDPAYPFQKSPTWAQIKTIHKEDFQNFMKHLRRSFETRYLVAGEFGSKASQRVHFHAVLFGKGQAPTWDLNKNTHVLQWPWGHVYVDDAVSETSIRYCVKYLLKGAKRKKTGRENKYNKEWVSYSRIPIMGSEFVLEHADRYVRERVFPHSFKYRPPFAHDNREYQLVGESQHVFLDRIFSQWPEALKIPKNERMERATLRYVKERQRRQWDALSSEEQKRLLDFTLVPSNAPSRGDLRLFAAFLADRLKETGHGSSIETFKRQFPEDYGLARAAFRRDLTKKPPTNAEAGFDFARRSGATRR